MPKRVKIVAVGRVKEKYILEGIKEFIKRLKVFCDLEIVEIKNEATLSREEEKIDNYLIGETYILDPIGKSYDSEEFAQLFVTDTQKTFIIGGSEGFSTGFKKKAKLLSLSRMTFLHEMTRLILLEQIYRSFMILNKRKYHK